MSTEAKLELDGKSYTLPTVEGSEGEKAVDVSALRANTNYITLDDGYGNTGSCTSKVTFIDGDKGILRYRGIPIEQMAEKSNFVETAYLVIYGELPNAAKRKEFGLLPAFELRYPQFNKFDRRIVPPRIQVGKGFILDGFAQGLHIRKGKQGGLIQGSRHRSLVVRKAVPVVGQNVCGIFHGATS